MRWEIHDDYDEVCHRAATHFLDALDRNPRIVLGMPTGRTPLGMYQRVVSACGVRPRCFAYATTFNLDEYVGITADHPASYRAYMERHLVRHTDLAAPRIHVPDGSRTGDAELAAEAARYEAEIVAAGGLDLTFLGLGRNGHIAFNEPGTPFDSRTRVVGLTASTRAANAGDFASPDEVPHRALTVGIATLLDSTCLVLLASGEAKRDAVRRLQSGEIDPAFPASALHLHPDVTVLVDRAAAGSSAEAVGAGSAPG